jgi:hypothetical protein
MPKKPKKPKIPPNPTSKISPKKLAPPQGIRFSFTYLQTNHPKFPCNHQDAKYFSVLLERLKNISTMTFTEITVKNAANLRCHPIDWSDRRVTEKCFGIPNEEQLVDTPYQLFQVSANEYGRVHGFFIEEENIFYIVWLDPNHNLYS